MNKKNLIAAISAETTFSKDDVNRVMASLTRIIIRTLNRGDKVSITGFGHFGVIKRPARMGINPLTKERITIPSATVPKFRAGKQLREEIR